MDLRFNNSKIFNIFKFKLQVDLLLDHPFCAIIPANFKLPQTFETIKVLTKH